MIILGLHRDPWHNTGAAMIGEENGSVQFVNLAEERLNREKDSRRFPELSTKACMQHLGVEDFDQIDLVVLDYIVRPDWKSDEHKRPCLRNTFLEHIPSERIYVMDHHLAHAYNVFYSSPFDEAAVLIVDGRGSQKETQSLFVANHRGIELVESTTRIGCYMPP